MAKKEIVEIACRVVAGEVDLLEGCRAIVRNQDGLTDEDRNDPDLMTLVAIESETDDLPLGRVRDLWERSALAEPDRRRAAIVSRTKKDLIQACRALIEKFSVEPRMSLVEQFLKEECTWSVCERIRGAVLQRDRAGERKELGFNRFDLILDFEKGIATVHDITDVSDRGSTSIGFTELLDCLRELD